MKRVFYIIPVVVFAGLALLLYVGLFQGPPSELPSPLVGKAAPDFSLPALDSRAQPFSRSDLGAGHPVIVNFWASWCAPCRIEHPALQELAARRGVILYGIDYKDNSDKARSFLDELGNPFNRIDQDQEGRVSIDWGVTGVPETFVIDDRGVIRVHYAGPLDEQVINRLILPAMAEKSGGTSTATR